MIAGYHAALASEVVSVVVIVFIQVTLATHSPDNAEHFARWSTALDAIQEAYSLTGDADYVVKVVVQELKTLSASSMTCLCRIRA